MKTRRDTAATLAAGTLLIGTLLVGAPSRASAVPRAPTLRFLRADAPPLTPAQREELASLVDAVKLAVGTAGEDPEIGRDSLRRALNELAARPGLTAQDEGAYRVQLDGLLTLARADLELDEEADAIRSLDQAIRIARGETVPASDYGPSLAKLHDLRVAAPELRPEGSIHVECPTQCRVVLDGREAGLGTDVMIAGVPLGPHRIRIEPGFEVDDRGFEKPFTLSAGTTSQVFSYTPPAAPAGATAKGTPTDNGQTTGSNTGDHRRFPRWAGITGVVVGVAAVVGGAVLLAVDGTCPDGSDPMSANACENTLDTLGVGAALTALGGAAVVGFSVGLGISEVRQKRHRNASSARVGLSFRF